MHCGSIFRIEFSYTDRVWHNFARIGSFSKFSIFHKFAFVFIFGFTIFAFVFIFKNKIRKWLRSFFDRFRPFSSLSASAWETLRLLHSTRMWGITRDEQGCHHLPSTPQSWGTVISKGSCAPEHHAHIQGNYPYPLGLRPYGSTSKNMGKPEGTKNHHLNPSSTSTHTSHMNV
jgi:hypothetical protein